MTSPAPGAGQGKVNVGTGNLVFQDDDMSVAHKGVPIALRRTYNSQSQHNVSGSDGAPAAMYGNGWTNTFDAHLTGDAATALFRLGYRRCALRLHWKPVGRVDTSAGAARDPRLGRQLRLSWTKKSGTTYYFYGPNENLAVCPYSWAQYGGFGGRLFQIIGRNRNTTLSLSYAWDGGNSSPTGKISSIAVQAESGLTATMAFADAAGHRLLQTLTYPDGATTVQYAYDAAGNLPAYRIRRTTLRECALKTCTDIRRSARGPCCIGQPPANGRLGLDRRRRHGILFRGVSTHAASTVTIVEWEGAGSTRRSRMVRARRCFNHRVRKECRSTERGPM